MKFQSANRHALMALVTLVTLVLATTSLGVGSGAAASPPTFVARAAASGLTTSLTVAAPPGVLTGDLQVAVVATGTASETPNTPAGWTKIAALTNSGATYAGWSFGASVFTSRSTAPVSFTKSGKRAWHVVRSAYRNAASLGPASIVSRTGTTHALPPATTVGSSDLVVGGAVTDGVSGMSFSPPKGWTERYDSALTSEHLGLTVADVVAPTPTKVAGVVASGRADTSLAFALVIKASAEPSPAVTPPAPAGWTPLFVDDFNTLDLSKWSVKNNTYASNEDSYLLASNVSTSNGALVIQGKKESVGGRAYTSGYIQSNGKSVLPNYFRAEVRAKVSFEQGMWAAPLWFRPENGSDGEIDLIETYGRELNQAHMTIHTQYGAEHQQLARAYPIADPEGWHTYTIEKTPSNTTMWIDGVVKYTAKTSTPAWYNQFYEVSGRTWNMRVNQQIGGTWGGLPDSSTDWNNAKMQIDYIKAWKPTV